MMLPGADRARRVPRLVSTKTGISGSMKQTHRCGLCLRARRSLGILFLSASFWAVFLRGERKIDGRKIGRRAKIFSD